MVIRNNLTRVKGFGKQGNREREGGNRDRDRVRGFGKQGNREREGGNRDRDRGKVEKGEKERGVHTVYQRIKKGGEGGGAGPTGGCWESQSDPIGRVPTRASTSS